MTVDWPSFWFGVFATLATPMVLLFVALASALAGQIITTVFAAVSFAFAWVKSKSRRAPASGDGIGKEMRY